MIDPILRVVAERFGVSVADIRSARRTRQLLPARHVAAYLAHTACGMSPREIGRRLGGRDYTSIEMYCRAVRRRMQEDEEFNAVVEQLKARLHRPGLS